MHQFDSVVVLLAAIKVTFMGSYQRHRAQCGHVPSIEISPRVEWQSDHRKRERERERKGEPPVRRVAIGGGHIALGAFHDTILDSSWE